MAAPLFVTLKAEIKSNNVSAIKADALKKAACEVMIAAINGSSGGRLTTKTKNDNGYILTANITLKGDNPKTPTKLEVSIAIIAVSVGTAGAKGFTGNANGKMDGLSKNLQGDAEELVSDVLKPFMTGKAIPAMK
jgi:hypothetical protein